MSIPLRTYAGCYTRCERCGVYDRDPEWCDLCGKAKDPSAPASRVNGAARVVEPAAPAPPKPVAKKPAVKRRIAPKPVAKKKRSRGKPRPAARARKHATKKKPIRPKRRK